MLPIYFFSVLLMFICGILFSFLAPYELFEKRETKILKLDIVHSQGFLVLGSLFSLTIAIAKIFLPVKNSSGMTVYFFGDFLTVLVLFLCFVFFMFRSLVVTDKAKDVPNWVLFLCKNDFALGYLCFLTATLHLFFSSVMVL